MRRRRRRRCWSSSWRSPAARALRDRHEPAVVRAAPLPAPLHRDRARAGEGGGLDPALLAAVIYQESKFHPTARSCVGRDRADAAHARRRRRGSRSARAGRRSRSATSPTRRSTSATAPGTSTTCSRSTGRCGSCSPRTTRARGTSTAGAPRGLGIQFPETRAYVDRVEHLERVYHEAWRAQLYRADRQTSGDARLGESGLRDPGHGRAGRGRRGPAEGRPDRAGAGDPDQVPREHHGRPAQRGPRPQPARGGGRLLARAAGRRDRPRAGDPRRRRPARERPRAPVGGGLATPGPPSRCATSGSRCARAFAASSSR